MGEEERWGCRGDGASSGLLRKLDESKRQIGWYNFCSIVVNA